MFKQVFDEDVSGVFGNLSLAELDVIIDSVEASARRTDVPNQMKALRFGLLQFCGTFPTLQHQWYRPAKAAYDFVKLLSQIGFIVPKPNHYDVMVGNTLRLYEENRGLGL